MYLVDVLIEYSTDALDRPFTYYSEEAITSGVRVRVNFRGRMLMGYVLNVVETKQTRAEYQNAHGFMIKKISQVVDQEPLLNDELLELAYKLADMTISPLMSCLTTMLPPSLKPNSSKKTGIIHLKAIRVIKKGEAKTPKQNALLEELLKEGTHYAKDYSRAMLASLEKQGLIESYDQEVRRDPYVGDLKVPKKTITLTTEQQAVVDGILASNKQVSLIHGVTGSGKTEVYIALTRKMLEAHKGVIMLVPEIALTPMMVAIFKQRFGDQVAILHSRLSSGERYDEYRRIKNHEVSIVVGARSAIFAPLDQLGLIIMDEEHDSSYKQESTPRYVTLTIAKMRAKYHHAKIVLGSATPSVESYARCERGFYDLYQLPHRINKRPLPPVTIVNMEEETRAHNYSLMSRLMKQKLTETLEKGEQAIILLNKRGYASFVKCQDCNEIVKCPHCDVTLTYHKVDDTLRCHYCDYRIPMIQRCPHCGSYNIKRIGYGTESIEEEISHTIPKARVIRYDYDTTHRKNEHTKLLNAFENQEGNILLGTQMIAKGLDFENVTFVGVLMADLTLTIPDYRSSERTFELLAQVAGRSGRGAKEGSVIIQTFNPDHYAITCAANHDYLGFYEQEMRYRREADYPPYCHLVAIIVMGENEGETKRSADDLKMSLEGLRAGLRILGPSEASIYRMKDVYRMRLLVKYRQNGPILHQLLVHKVQEYNVKRKAKVRVVCDYHPYTQL